MSSTQVNPTCPTTNTECPRCLFEPALPVRELSSLSADPRLVLVEIHAGKNPNESEASVIRPIRKKKAEASRPISWKRALTGWPQENTQGNLVRVYGIRAACCEDRRESPKMALADSTCSAANVSGVARRGDPASDGKGNIVIPASQREQNASISTFVQFGINNSETLPVKEYLGLGFTGFGLVPHRPGDSIGVGMAWSWLAVEDIPRSWHVVDLIRRCVTSGSRLSRDSSGS